jgi:hypothetical protein
MEYNFYNNVISYCVSPLQDLAYELPSSLANVIEDQFYQKWRMLMIDLHYVGAFFNPYLLGEAHLHDGEDVENVLNRVL